MKSIRLAATLLAAGVLTHPLIGADDMPFDFEVLQYRAKSLAAKAYVPRVTRVPKSLQELDYDEYRKIRYDATRTWWKREQLPFQLQFFHPGFIYNKTVQITELDQGRESLIEFSPKLFLYGKDTDFGRVPGDVGFTGLKVLHPLNNPLPLDELIVFQGASYFRALAQQMHYGLSARGLAVNTAEAGGEEFPVFEEFWVQKPAADSKEITVYALMDSPSVAGAYRFVIKPGAATVMHVKAALYLRDGGAIKSLGMAPLTSMFWFGENTDTRHGDLRPEVHDSDGLMIERGTGEWIWRPLTNPNAVRVAAFSDENPRGFGLIQRDRQFGSYEDLEAASHLRPSVWVEPVGAWGKGSVRLVEIPTPDETNDNIVAFWVPETLPAAGAPLVYEYKLHWFFEGRGGKTPPAAFTVSTRQGFSKTHEADLRRFWVDFDGKYMRGRPSDSKIQAVVTVGEGATLIHHDVQKNPYSGTWRAAFAIKPDGSGRPVELRCFLKRDPHILTETWSYLWNP